LQASTIVLAENTSIRVYLSETILHFAHCFCFQPNFT